MICFLEGRMLNFSRRLKIYRKEIRKEIPANPAVETALSSKTVHDYSIAVSPQ